MTAALADVDALLKTLYQDDVPEVGHKDPHTWSILPKKKGFLGRNVSVSTQYGRTPGTSHTFTTAQSRAGASNFIEFLVTRGTDYAVVQLDGETLEAARDYGAKVDYLARESKSAMDRMKHRMNRNIFRNHGMAAGRIASGGATQTITLTDALDTIFLNVGDQLVTSNTDGTSGSVDANATAISAIDRVNGTLTTAAASWDASGGFSDDDYIFLPGDFGLGYRGLASWFPTTAPTSGDSFFGVDRSVDPERLAGYRVVAAVADGNLETFLKRACVELGLQGGMPDVCVVNPIHWNQLDDHLGAKVRYGKVPAQGADGKIATIGFRSIEIYADTGMVNVISDRDCPRNDGYLLDFDHCCWQGLGEAPRYLTYGGVRNGAWLRIGNEDAMEGRIGARGNFWSDAPGKNARLTLTNVTT